MIKLNREEKRIINMLENHLFPKEYKIRLMKSITTFETHIYLNRFRNCESAINQIYDSIFDYESKIKHIKIAYELLGYKVQTLQDIIENRFHFIENEICTDWQTQQERRNQKIFYI